MRTNPSAASFVFVVVVLLQALLVALGDLVARLRTEDVHDLLVRHPRLEEANFALLTGRTADEHVGAVQGLGFDDFGLGQAAMLQDWQ